MPYLDEIDTVPRYVPSTILRNGFVLPVLRTIAHPPGKHPKGCPILSYLVAVEVVTEKGSRWFGFEKAWIDSNLRMAVSGFNARDEVRRRWELADSVSPSVDIDCIEAAP
jgi:hypothetical protein